MKRLGFLISTTIALFCTTSSSVNAETIVLFEDNFNTESNSPWATLPPKTDLDNWNVVDGSIDVLGTGYGGTAFDFFPGNGYYLDLDGASNNAATLESKSLFSFEAGDIVNLSFDLGSYDAGPDNIYPDNTVTVSLGSIFSESFTLAVSDNPFTTISRTINVNSLTDAFLTFDHTGQDNVGILLDNVQLSVDRETESVPEPSITAALLILGGLGIKSLRQRQYN